MIQGGIVGGYYGREDGGGNTGGLTQADIDTRVRALALLGTSFSAVASQSELDALTLTGRVVLARVTTAFGSYSVDDILIRDTTNDTWVKIANIADAVVSSGVPYIAPSSVAGTANAIALTPPAAILSYTAGLQYTFFVKSTNTGAVTVAVSGLAARPLRKSDGSAFAAGELPTGRLVTITYNSTRTRFVADIDTQAGYTPTADDIKALLNLGTNDPLEEPSGTRATGKIPKLNASNALEWTDDETGSGTIYIANTDDIPDSPVDGQLIKFRADVDVSGETGNTFRNADDTADVTQALTGEVYEFEETGTKWVQRESAPPAVPSAEIERVNILDDPVSAFGDRDLLLSADAIAIIAGGATAALISKTTPDSGIKASETFTVSGGNVIVRRSTPGVFTKEIYIGVIGTTDYLALTETQTRLTILADQTWTWSELKTHLDAHATFSANYEIEVQGTAGSTTLATQSVRQFSGGRAVADTRIDMRKAGLYHIAGYIKVMGQSIVNIRNEFCLEVVEVSGSQEQILARGGARYSRFNQKVEIRLNDMVPLRASDVLKIRVMDSYADLAAEAYNHLRRSAFSVEGGFLRFTRIGTVPSPDITARAIEAL